MVENLGLNIAYKTVYQLVRYSLGAKLKFLVLKGQTASWEYISL